MTKSTCEYLFNYHVMGWRRIPSNRFEAKLSPNSYSWDCSVYEILYYKYVSMVKSFVAWYDCLFSLIKRIKVQIPLLIDTNMFQWNSINYIIYDLTVSTIIHVFTYISEWINLLKFIIPFGFKNLKIICINYNSRPYIWSIFIIIIIFTIFVKQKHLY